MKRSKNQALYKFLPGMWVSDGSESGTALTSKISSWNHRKMEGIYQSYIEGEIKRQIIHFGNRGGDISSFDIGDANSFSIVEPACNANVPDVFGTISPLFFYCNYCGNSFMLKSGKDIRSGTWKCDVCNKGTIKQLQMIYTCECGTAEPITLPYVNSKVKKWMYRPNEDNYSIQYQQEDGLEKKAQFIFKCRNCDNNIRPDNATAGRNYKPFSSRMINLVDTKSGDFFDKGLKAHKVVVARWLNKVNAEEYRKIIEDSNYAFDSRNSLSAEKAEAERVVRDMLDTKLITPDMYDSFVKSILDSNKKNKKSVSVDECEIHCDDIFFEKRKNNEEYKKWLEEVAFRLMQYYTIKDSQKLISLEDSIQRQLELELIDDEKQVIEINRKLGIRSAQVACDSQIVTCVYGYTRKTEDPKNNKNSNCPHLKLNSFDKDKNGKNIVFASMLNTEGLLIELNLKRIILWLYQNGIVPEEMLPDLEDELSVKKWFALNIHGDAISNFAEVDDEITGAVFGLLHSMSHAFITAIGEISGLSSNSLSEIIFTETASIFIYAQTSQGIPLGAISGMFECRFYQLLRNVLKDSKNCVFDPICEDRDDSSCTGCMIISDTSCSCFNKMLGRKYLYSLSKVSQIHTGFWEM